MNGMASVTTLDAPVFTFSIVLDFLRDFDKGGCLLRPRVIVSVSAARLLAVVPSRIPTAVIVGGSTLVA